MNIKILFILQEWTLLLRTKLSNFTKSTASFETNSLLQSFLEVIMVWWVGYDSPLFKICNSDNTNLNKNGVFVLWDPLAPWLWSRSHRSSTLKKYEYMHLLEVL